MPSIDIRFVRGTALSSAMIAFEEGVSMPFAPSHTEARTKDGLFYIGAQNGGVEKLPVGYDGGHVMTLPDGRLADIIASLPCSQEQEDGFYASLDSKLGEPYDWLALAGFAGPNRHVFGHIICSALMTLELRKINWFPKPLTKPFHRISPDELLFALSTHVEIPH